MLDEKLDKVDFENSMTSLNENMLEPMQKSIDKCKKDIECIEVSQKLLKHGQWI